MQSDSKADAEYSYSQGRQFLIELILNSLIRKFIKPVVHREKSYLMMHFFYSAEDAKKLGNTMENTMPRRQKTYQKVATKKSLFFPLQDMAF